MQISRYIFRLPVLLAVCLPLQGCLVASAVDLAATTVLTAGKLAVKGTGAVINAAIPDKKEKTDEADKAAQDKAEPTSGQTQPVIRQGTE